MAGSLSHLIDEETGEFRFDLIENMGDAYEACEDCVTIIKNIHADAKKAKEELEQLEQFLDNWYDNATDYNFGDIHYHMQLAARRVEHLKKLLSNCSEKANTNEK